MFVLRGEGEQKLLSSREPPHPTLSREGERVPGGDFQLPLPSRERSEMVRAPGEGEQIFGVRRSPLTLPSPARGEGSPDGQIRHLVLAVIKSLDPFLNKYGN